MAGERHKMKDVATFLDDNYCQVWAVDRRTGEYQYLPDGMAEEYRARAKRDWKCPVPGCIGPINTRGKSRRDHFYHMNTVDHPTESEAHLAAKAMLSQWARSVIPAHCTVREEMTIKDIKQDVHRRPDVAIMDGMRTVALEVEYKNFQPDMWREKQQNYDDTMVVCTWLIGHTRVKLAEEQEPSEGPAMPVKISKLAKTIGGAGHHVLVINPTDQLVGTLAGDKDFTCRPDPSSSTAWLWIHPLSECELTARQGLVTPGTKRIENAIEASVRAAEALRLSQESDARRQAELDERELPARRALASNAAVQRAPGSFPRAVARWTFSDERQRLLTHFKHVPEFVRWRAHTNEESALTEASPEHWHAIIYLDLIHDRRTGSSVTVKQALEALENHSITVTSTSGREAVRGYLRNLKERGFLAQINDDNTFVLRQNF